MKIAIFHILSFSLFSSYPSDIPRVGKMARPTLLSRKVQTDNIYRGNKKEMIVTTNSNTSRNSVVALEKS